MPRPLHIPGVALAIVLLLLGGRAGAQDIHYAHLAAVPTQTNPAYAGLIDARARVAVDYRGQWNTFVNGYRTSSLSADMKAYQFQDDIIGVGFHLSSDQAGDLNFTQNSAALSLSYLKSLDRQTFLSFGIQNNFSSHRIDWTQAVGFDFEPVAPAVGSSSRSFWDVGVGMAFFTRPSRTLGWFAGAAVSHVNRPTVTFLGDVDGSLGNELYAKLTVHGGAEVKFGKFNSIRPSLIYLAQGPHRELKVGTFWRYKADRGIHTDAEVAVHFGAWLRTYVGKGDVGVDAAIVATRFDYRRTSVTLSFDINISSLTRISDGIGGPEFSLIQEFDWEMRKRRRRPVECPTFHF